MKTGGGGGGVSVRHHQSLINANSNITCCSCLCLRQEKATLQRSRKRCNFCQRWNASLQTAVQKGLPWHWADCWETLAGWKMAARLASKQPSEVLSTTGEHLPALQAVRMKGKLRCFSGDGGVEANGGRRALQRAVAQEYAAFRFTQVTQRQHAT